MLMLPIWGSICDGQSHLGLFLDNLNNVFWNLRKVRYNCCRDWWLLKPLTLMSMGERLQHEKYFYIEYIEVYQWGWMIDEEDLKERITVGILGTRCFSSMLPSMPKGEIIGSINDNDIPRGEYCGKKISSLSWWYVTFMIVFVIDVNMAVFCDIWQKNNEKIKLVWIKSEAFSQS